MSVNVQVQSGSRGLSAFSVFRLGFFCYTVVVFGIYAVQEVEFVQPDDWRVEQEIRNAIAIDRGGVIQQIEIDDCEHNGFSFMFNGIAIVNGEDHQRVVQFESTFLGTGEFVIPGKTNLSWMTVNEFLRSE